MAFLKDTNSIRDFHNVKTTAGTSRFCLRLMKILDATLGYWLCWILGYLHYLRNPQKTAVPPGMPKRILIIRPGGMGDMILLIPVLQYLAKRFPSARLDIICEKRNMDVLRFAGFEKNAIAYDAGISWLINLLSSRDYDIALDTEQFHNFSAIIAFWSGAAVRIGFKINPQRNLLYTHLVNYDLDGYEGIQFSRLLGPLDPKDFSYRLEGSIPISGTTVRQQEKLNSLAGNGKFATLHAGSTSIYKQWDTGKFSALVRTLVTERDCPIVLIGGQADIEPSNKILMEAGSSGKVVSFAGDLTLQETAEIIRRSKLFISGDSGLAHLAIAVGTPTVVIFGATDPEKWGFRDSRHGIVRKSLACSPCFIFGYHKLCRSIDCMKDISAEEVLAVCDDLLKNTQVT